VCCRLLFLRTRQLSAGRAAVHEHSRTTAVRIPNQPVTTDAGARKTVQLPPLIVLRVAFAPPLTHGGVFSFFTLAGAFGMDDTGAIIVLTLPLVALSNDLIPLALVVTGVECWHHHGGECRCQPRSGWPRLLSGIPINQVGILNQSGAVRLISVDNKRDCQISDHFVCLVAFPAHESAK
jgi:hypothetical protein